MSKTSIDSRSRAEWLPLTELTPDPDNANVHNARSIKAIARSLLRFGMRKNIVADKYKVIRAGNGTYEALQWIASHITDSPEDEAMRDKAKWHGLLREVKKGKKVTFEPYILCEVTDLEADEATAFALADNQTGRLSSSDFEKVASQLGDLKTRTAIDDLGWADFELEPMLAAEWSKPAIEELPGHHSIVNEMVTVAENIITFSARDYAVIMQCVAKYRATLPEEDAVKILDGEVVRVILQVWSEAE